MAVEFERKINDIKWYKEYTGCGLKEAKDAVDAMWETHASHTAQVAYRKNCEAKNKRDQFPAEMVRLMNTHKSNVQDGGYYGDDMMEGFRNMVAEVERLYGEANYQGHMHAHYYD